MPTLTSAGNRLPVVEGTAIVLPLVVDSRFATDFTALVTNAGSTLGRLAMTIGVDVLLLQNVAVKRQALPLDVAEAIADALNLDVHTVLGAAGFVTLRRGEIYSVPIPVDPTLGPLRIQSIARLAPPPVAKASVQGMYVCGAALCTGNTADGVIRIDPAYGVVGEVATFADPTASPYAVAFGPNGRLYSTTVGRFGTGHQMNVLSLEPFSQMAEFADANLDVVVKLSYEASTNTLWGSNRAGGGGVFVLEPSGLTTRVALGVAPPMSYGVVSTGGYVYASGTVDASNVGGLYKIDPGSLTVVDAAVGDVTTLGNARGVATDGAGHFVVLDALATNRVAVVFASNFSTVVAVSVALPAGRELQNALRVSYHRGEWWVTSERPSSADIRVLRLRIAFDDVHHTATAAVFADYTMAGSGEQGFVAFDGDGRPWYSSPGDGTVRSLDSAIVTGDPTVRAYAVGGTPAGLVWL